MDTEASIERYFVNLCKKHGILQSSTIDSQDSWSFVDTGRHASHICDASASCGSVVKRVLEQLDPKLQESFDS